MEKISFSFPKEHDYKPVLRDVLLDCQMCIRDRSHPDWWQDKKNPDRHGIRIPVFDENGVQKIGARNRKQWKRVLTDATGWLSLIHI